jgi:hypothetical protein
VCKCNCNYNWTKPHFQNPNSLCLTLYFLIGFWENSGKSEENNYYSLSLSLSLACFSLFFLLFLNLRVNFLLRWLIWLSYSLFDINYWVHWSIVVYVVEIRNLLIGNCKYLFSFSDYSFFINLVTIVFYKFSD